MLLNVCIVTDLIKPLPYVRKFESHVQIANRCAPLKISDGVEKFVLQALQFQKMLISRELPGGASISHYNPNECFVEG
jgi:hypothetical protein